MRLKKTQDLLTELSSCECRTYQLGGVTDLATVDSG
jgi:hypothetical protein